MAASPDEVLSFRETVTLLENFLETAFHLILFIRHIYPREMFAERQEFGVKVWQSRHPTLNEYIGRAVKGVADEISKGSLKKVALVIKEASLQETPLERFVFDIAWLISDLPKDGLDFTPLKGGLPRGHVEDHFRGFLLKLMIAESYLLRLPDDVTFSIVIELQEDAQRPESEAVRKGLEPMEWVPAHQQDAPKSSNDLVDVDGSRDGRSTIAPLKSTRLGLVNLQMLVEETNLKFGNESELESSAEDPAARRRRQAAKGKGRAV